MVSGWEEDNLLMAVWVQLYFIQCRLVEREWEGALFYFAGDSQRDKDMLCLCRAAFHNQTYSERFTKKYPFRGSDTVTHHPFDEMW